MKERIKKVSLRKKIWGVMLAVILLVTLGSINALFEDVDAGQIVVIQAPITGKLSVYTQPGWVGQWFGKATHYEKSAQFWFNNDEGKKVNGTGAIKARWNDAGEAFISGSARYKLPLETSKMIELHSIYGSQEAIEKELIETNVRKAVYMTGPLMSSKESYAEKRSYLIQLIEDQANKGVYQTIQKDVKTVDPISGQEKTITIVEVQYDSTGHILRQEISPLVDYGVTLSNFAIEGIVYDAKVESQIEAQRKATMEVQTAMAKAKEAEQRALTVEKEGEADAAQAKWEQEVIAAKQITQAEMRRKVAEEDVKTAELEKRKAILEGEGEAAKKRLVMQADGALKQKLDAWLKAEEMKWNAFAQFKGNLVPMYQSGMDGKNSTNAMQYMEIMGIKAMKDISLDMQTK
ncbi:MAG: SPFH domain-containing protein [Flavipsychrobacter sp.]